MARVETWTRRKLKPYLRTATSNSWCTRTLLASTPNTFEVLETGRFEKVKKCLRLGDLFEGTLLVFQFWLYAQATREEGGFHTKKHTSEHTLPASAGPAVLDWEKVKGTCHIRCFAPQN